MNKPNYFANNLRHLLKLHGYSQAQLGKMIGKDRTSVGIYIKGTSQPDLDVTIHISEIFKVSLDHLLLHDMDSENFSRSEMEKKTVLNEESPKYEQKPINEVSNAIAVLAKAFNNSLEIKNDLNNVLDINKAMNEKVDYIFSHINRIELEKEIEATKEILSKKNSRAQ